ncbi:MAG: hypothetical protein GX446_10545 [Chthonomonadales bacterium]|nr:hypothetical protein [Chthonomonadales bacterium]
MPTALCLAAVAHSQTSGRWLVTSWTYSGTTTSIKNGQGGQQQWPPNGPPLPPPTQTFGTGDEVTVAMSGTITAVVQWVDANGNPTTSPPSPAEVYLLQRTAVHWSYGGEDVSAEPGTVAESLNAGLPDAQYQSSPEPNCSRTLTARKLVKVDGSSGTITLPVTLLASLRFTCASGVSGNATATVTYGVTEVAPADCYDFSGYPNSPPGPPGSTPCAQDAAAKLQGPLLDGTGYYTEGRAYTNQTAQHALEQLKKTAIFYVFGHGGSAFQSCQTFWNNDQWGYMVETEYAKRQIVNSGVPEERVVALATLPAGALNKVLLAVFQGCYTGYYNASWGSPVHGAVAKGADCALGFTGPITDPGAHTWATRFWDNLKNGDTVYRAWQRAASGLFAYGVSARKFEGEVEQYLRVRPARYGN